MLQFSSGSTGDPKGSCYPIKSHDQYAGYQSWIEEDARRYNIQLDAAVSRYGADGISPHTSDSQWNDYLIEPVDFIKNPGLWLDTMTKMRTTITGCPNFGQVLVNRFVQRKQNQNWDLSSVRTVFNGAEPISVPAMREFMDLLAPFGLSPESMFPAYGMAEATLAITFASLEDEPTVKSFCRTKLLRDGVVDEHSEGEPDTMELVSLGKSLRNCAIRITDLNGLPLGEDKVGIVEVKGDNVTSGYYNAPEATQEALFKGWLRTGDLGFIHEGDLFIMGRAKDVIFISGMNYYASDLEHVALQMKEIAIGRIVMAGYFDEKEGHDKVLVFLVSPDNQATRDLFRKIQQHFQHTIGLLIDTFIPIRSNDIPRTSSGKIQRYKMVQPVPER